MKGDFSRMTFNPRKHFNRVLMQQGRVQLDADWNKQRDIAEHQLRTQLLDLIGPSGAPKGNPPATPEANGFKIEPLPGANDDFIIHPGRMYVQGFMCELEPGTPVPLDSPPPPNANAVDVAVQQVDGLRFAAGQWVEFLDHLAQPLGDDGKPVDVGTSPARHKITDVAENSGKWKLTLDSALKFPSSNPPSYLRRVVIYLTQPYWPKPDTINASKPNLVYLDVWERTITALEDPSIREVALNGADTAVRSQIVWQVKLCETTHANNITTAFQTFEAGLPQPSQMTVRRLSPAATILTNQLYRVEIHTCVGAWKWARDNASVVALVNAIADDGTTITLVNGGRHANSGFIDCKWVEITNMQMSLDGEPGVMVAIEKSDGQTLTVKDPTVLHPLPKSLTQSPHHIVRRWEGYKPQIATGFNDLEESIQVCFDSDANQYQPGDYWLIPARTNSTSGIEWPLGHVQHPLPLPQPPLGIQHAYGPLGFFSSSGPEDHRPQFANLTGGLVSKTGDTMTGALTIDQRVLKKPSPFDIVAMRGIEAGIATGTGDCTLEELVKQTEVPLSVQGHAAIGNVENSAVYIGLIKDGTSDIPAIYMHGNNRHPAIYMASDNGARHKVKIDYASSNAPTSEMAIQGYMDDKLDEN